MSQWYYSDYQRNRLGPVAASDLADLHNAGQLQPDTLVWREGMPQWRAWREVMTQALNEAAGRAPVEAAPLSAGVNPYAMAEPQPSAAPASAPAAATGPSLGTLSSAPSLGAGANPYAVAEPQSPYAPPRAAIESAGHAVFGGDVVQAGFLKRLAAMTIDGLLFMLLFFVLFALAMGMGMIPGAMSAAAGNAGIPSFAPTFLLLVYGVPIVAQFAYFSLMHASRYQATLGKMAVGIKVVDSGGDRMSLGRSMGRFAVRFVLYLVSCGITDVVSAFMSGLHSRKQALHDLMVGTEVVDRWAYTEHPERQRRELGTVTVVVLILLGLLIVGYFMMIFVAIGTMGMAASQ